MKRPDDQFNRDLRVGRLWSLWEMLKVSAAEYIHAGEQFESLSKGLWSPPDANSDALLPEDVLKRLVSDYQILSGHCAMIGLDVTHGVIEETFKRHYGPAQPLTFRAAHVDFTAIQRAFKSELSQRMFMHVLSHRVPYYCADGSPRSAGREIEGLLTALDDFPSAQYDAIEAGNCFAFERFTACVYHLMRVAEYGLVSVGMAAKVESSDHRSWDKVIAGIHRHINLLMSQKPTPDWKDQEKKFSDLCSWFTTIRNGWRNPVSHIPRIYTESVAKGMFSATVTLFERLKREGIQQVEMQAIPTLAFEDPSEDV